MVFSLKIDKLGNDNFLLIKETLIIILQPSLSETKLCTLRLED